MPKNPSDGSDLKLKPFSWVWLVPAALSGLYPLVRYWEEFSELFYQGDEWDQLHIMESTGYVNWVFTFYGENFVPVFKLFWSGVLIAGNGNYFVLTVTSFLMHVLVVLLLGTVLRRSGFGLFATLFCQLVLALNYTHIEILTQTVQVSNLLAYTFFLLLLIPFTGDRPPNQGLSAGWCIIIALLSIVGALSFSRGVLNGVTVCVAVFVLGASLNPKLNRLRTAALSALVPSLLIIATLAIWAFNHSVGVVDTTAHWGKLGSHFFYQLSLNPWYQQIRDLHISLGLAFLLLGLNLICVILGLYWAKAGQRLLLLIFLLFFLGNAALLAFGRSHLPIDHVASWRYQYGAILFFSPFVAVLLEKCFSYPPVKYLPVSCSAVILWWVVLWVYPHWKYYIVDWTEDRGTSARLLLESEELDPEGHSVSRFDKVNNARVRELQEKYNLH